MEMRPEIVKKIQEDRERQRESIQIPLQIPVPESPESHQEEEVSVISRVVEIEI